jgi:hypothetical protein
MGSGSRIALVRCQVIGLMAHNYATCTLNRKDLSALMTMSMEPAYGACKDVKVN